MAQFVIIETDVYNDIPEDPSERCYLNHAYLSSMSFGSADMAWIAESELEAEGMSAKLDQSNYRHHKIIPLEEVTYV